MNYRKFYESQTGEAVPAGFDVHHINSDRKDNRIENLVALPKQLHHDLHQYTPPTITLNTNLTGQIRPGAGALAFYVERLNEFEAHYHEGCKWVDYRDHLRGLIPNIHMLSYQL